MCFAQTLIPSHQCRQGNTLWRGECSVPSGTMLHGAHLLATLVHVFSRRSMPNESLASDRVLTLRETLEMFLTDFTAETPLLGQPSVPLATNLVRFRVIVLAGVAELFRVVRLGLACAERIGDGQHGRVDLLEIPLPPRRSSARFLLGVLF